MKPTNSWTTEKVIPPATSANWEQWILSVKNRNEKNSVTSCLMNVQGFEDEHGWELPDGGELDAVVQWLDTATEAEYTDERIRQVLVLAYQSYLLLDGMSRSRWVSMIHRILRYCDEIGKCTIWGRNVLMSEIPTVLVTLYPDWEVTRTRIPRICASLCNETESELDGAGLIHAEHWNEYAPVLACWTRTSWLISECCNQITLPPSFDAQLQWGVRQLLLLSNSRGQMRFSDGRALSKSFIQTLLQLAGDASDMRIAVDSKLAAANDASAKLNGKRPAASMYSEWAQIGMLRSGWSSKRRELAVRFHQHEFEIELDACGHPLLHGVANTRLKINNFDLKPKSDWCEVCWLDDDDVSYLELEMEYDDDWRIQRQLCVCKNASVVLIADAVLGGQPSDIQYEVQYRVVKPHGFSPGVADTQDLIIDRDNFRGIVMPLALPEWRESGSQKVHGELHAKDKMSYSMRARDSRGLYAPLLFSLGRRSADKPSTWRNLTVAERLSVESDDSAVAFRAQVGGRQWLLYRSLTKPANRTFLGQNYSTEFVFGEFRLDGKVREYVEIS